MTIVKHKRIVAAIPDDLKEGEEIEVSDDGIEWKTCSFHSIKGHMLYGTVLGMTSLCTGWPYARRPAAAKPKLKKDCWTCRHDKTPYHEICFLCSYANKWTPKKKPMNRRTK